MATSYGCGGCGVAAKQPLPQPVSDGPSMLAMPVNRVREPVMATVVRDASTGGCQCQGERRTMWVVIAGVAAFVLWKVAK
jgi:hypothetical protein